MTELYNQYGQQHPVIPKFNNPIEKMQFLMQAMRNPAAFVKQYLPDIPPQIQNDPNQILSYLQQTRHISNQDIQNLLSRNPYPGR